MPPFLHCIGDMAFPTAGRSLHRWNVQRLFSRFLPVRVCNTKSPFIVALTPIFKAPNECRVR